MHHQSDELLCFLFAQALLLGNGLGAFVGISVPDALHRFLMKTVATDDENFLIIAEHPESIIDKLAQELPILPQLQTALKLGIAYRYALGGVE